MIFLFLRLWIHILFLYWVEGNLGFSNSGAGLSWFSVQLLFVLFVVFDLVLVRCVVNLDQELCDRRSVASDSSI